MKVQPMPISGGAGYSSGEPSPHDAVTAAAPGAATTADTATAPTLQEVKTAVGDINHTIQSLVSHLEFFVDESASAALVKVVDTRTNDVIREFSTGKVLGIARALGKVQGLLLQESA